jgi:hypothetical protein
MMFRPTSIPSPSATRSLRLQSRCDKASAVQRTQVPVRGTSKENSMYKLLAICVVLALAGPATAEIAASLEGWGPIKFSMNLPEALAAGGRGAFEDRGTVRFPVEVDGTPFEAIVRFEGKGDHVKSIMLQKSMPDVEEEQCQMNAQELSARLAKRYRTEPANAHESLVIKQMKEDIIKMGRTPVDNGQIRIFNYSFSNAGQIEVVMSTGPKLNPRCDLEVRYTAPVFVSKQPF